MDRKIRIAFGCEAQVGKDTAFDYLSAKTGGVKFAFADAIYSIQHFAQEVCGFDKTKDREFLQWVGTEWARKKNKNVWVDIVSRKIEKIPDDVPVYVTDVRMQNEMDLLKELGFVLVKIDRPPHLRSEFGSGSKDHESEGALSKSLEWDAIIKNDGTLAHYYEQLDLLV